MDTIAWVPWLKHPSGIVRLRVHTSYFGDGVTLLAPRVVSQGHTACSASSSDKGAILADTAVGYVAVWRPANVADFHASNRIS